MEQLPDLPDERLPPHSTEAEQSLLGALLQDNAAMAVVGDLVEAAAFYHADHRAVFAAMADMQRQGQSADEISVWEWLRQHGIEHDTLDLAYLHQLTACVPSSRAARRYAEIVAERYCERELIAAADEAAKIAWQHGTPMSDRLDRIASELARVEARRKGPGRRVPLMRLAELREASAGVRWAVKHVLPAASVGMLFGGSGTFKSFIALDAALHVVHGLPWMGRLTRQGPALYIAAEGGSGLWPRIDAWHRERQLAWGDAPLYVVPQAVDLTQDAWRVVDAAQAVGVSPALVVVDTLSQTYVGEENSANEMAAYLRELGLRFRALWQCSVLLVHHSGHDATERPRGSSAIRANIDYLLGVHRDDKEMLATLSCVKQKDGELFNDATFAMSVVPLGTDEDGDQVTSLVARHLSTKEAVAAAQEAEKEAGRGGKRSLLMSLAQNGMRFHDLRKAFYEECGLDKDDSRRKAFGRAMRVAQDAGQIEVAEGFVLLLGAANA